MADIMRPIPFSQLMDWILTENKEHNTIFGIEKQVHHTTGKALPIFDEKIETLYGPAAGPELTACSEYHRFLCRRCSFLRVKDSSGDGR